MLSYGGTLMLHSLVQEVDLPIIYHKTFQVPAVITYELQYKPQPSTVSKCLQKLLPVVINSKPLCLVLVLGKQVIRIQYPSTPKTLFTQIPPPFSYIYIHIYLSGKWIITVRARAGTSHPSAGTYKVSNIRTIRVFRPQIAVVAIHIKGICPCQIHYLTEHA